MGPGRKYNLKQSENLCGSQEALWPKSHEHSETGFGAPLIKREGAVMAACQAT
jgi:hypothetical protein